MIKNSASRKNRKKPGMNRRIRPGPDDYRQFAVISTDPQFCALVKKLVRIRLDQANLFSFRIR